MERTCDCSGWATKNNIKCSDGRTIMPDAFKHNDGKRVPLVWNHRHDDPANILGHADLENRREGVYAYCTFNDSDAGQSAKLLVEHGDIVSLSILANQLLQNNRGEVRHGEIREVSLVLAGANPGAFIDSVMQHGEAVSDEGIIFTGEDIAVHSDDSNDADNEEGEEQLEHSDSKDENKEKAMSEKGKTLQDVVDSMTEEQQNAMYALIGQALEEAGVEDEDDDEGERTMKQNAFDNEDRENVLQHADMMAIFSDAKRLGTMSEAFLAHGIEHIDCLFPDAKNVTNQPVFIQRDMGWVSKIMNGVHHTPFSRIKSIFADITEDEARAKGYIKGEYKKEEVFTLLKRTTTPTTVYKKQKMDRDDVVDITDFDVIAWIKAEMRMMLDEELARAYLVGDGRLASSDDKINESNIRPIWKDDDLFTIKVPVKVAKDATEDDRARAFIRAAIKSRKNYKGSGNPSLFTTEDMLTDCLLLTDEIGRDLYDSVEKLATKLRVKEIVTVPVMEGLTRDDKGVTKTLLGIIANIGDYNVGADKGGAVNMFDDFDIDYNAQKYLIETRCSGALTLPFSAIALEEVTVDSASVSTPTTNPDEEPQG